MIPRKIYVASSWRNTFYPEDAWGLPSTIKRKRVAPYENMNFCKVPVSLRPKREGASWHHLSTLNHFSAK